MTDEADDVSGELRPRIDVLKNKPRTRFGGFRGRVLDDLDDGVLQDIVTEAAAATQQPTAAVTLLLERTEKFRASVGMSDDLRNAGGVDRSVSLCQFVVRDDAPFVVEDATGRTDLPTTLVGPGRLQRYVGVPVHIDGEVVGALCVTGDRPGVVSPREVQLLTALAARASARLTELAGTALRGDVIRLAAGPVFGELRNALSAVLGAGGALRFLAADLAPVERAMRARAYDVLPLLQDAAASIAELRGVSDDLDEGAGRVTRGVTLLQEVLTRADQPVLLGLVLERALGLADHVTKVHGGVRVAPVPQAILDVTRVTSVLASVLGAALSELARHTEAGVDVDVVLRAGDVHITVRPAAGTPLSLDTMQGILVGLQKLEERIALQAIVGALVLTAPICP